MKAYAYVKCGKSHTNGICEDTVLLNHTVHKQGFLAMELEDCFIIGVADGVGGSAHGEAASGITMMKLAELDASQLDCDLYKNAISNINRDLIEISNWNPRYKGMASTLTAFLCTKEEAFVSQLGNTRLYQVVDLGFMQQVILLTQDHNYINDLQRDIDVPENVMVESIENTALADCLTSYMGLPEEQFLHRLEITHDVDLSLARRIFITSDGIHDFIPPDKLSQCMQKDDTPEQLLKNMADMAIQYGSMDDLSVIMLEISLQK